MNDERCENCIHWIGPGWTNDPPGPRGMCYVDLMQLIPFNRILIFPTTLVTDRCDKFEPKQPVDD